MVISMTDQKTETLPAVSARQEVRDRGWTPEALRRATATLNDLVGERPVGHDDRDLAGELVRWLQHASDIDPEPLLDGLHSCRPLSPNAPQWDRLYGILAYQCPITELVAQLKVRYPDPVPALIGLLDGLTPADVALDDDDALDDAKVLHARRCVFDAQQRAFETLLALGTRESLTYVLSRLESFHWFEEGALDDVIKTRGAMIRSTALDIWPTLSWQARAGMATFLSGQSLVDDRVLGFVAATMPEGTEDLEGYLEMLGDFYDARVLPQIEATLRHVHETIESRSKQDTQQLVWVAIRQFVKLEIEPTADLRQRSEACGVRWEAGLVLLDQDQYAVGTQP
jgi:hypothetical protein